MKRILTLFACVACLAYSSEAEQRPAYVRGPVYIEMREVSPPTATPELIRQFVHAKFQDGREIALEEIVKARGKEYASGYDAWQTRSISYPDGRRVVYADVVRKKTTYQHRAFSGHLLLNYKPSSDCTERVNGQPTVGRVSFPAERIHGLRTTRIDDAIGAAWYAPELECLEVRR